MEIINCSLNTHFSYNISIDLDFSHSISNCNFFLYTVENTAFEMLAIDIIAPRFITFFLRFLLYALQSHSCFMLHKTSQFI